MERFKTTLIPGGKPPYDTWRFVVVPEAVVRAWGTSGAVPVRGTLAGAPFRGTVSRGEGVHRMPVTRALMDAAGVASDATVEVAIEPDPEPRPLHIPDELQAILDGESGLAALFDRLAPSCQRAWAQYVGEAKRPETRLRRAEKAPEGIRSRAFPR